MCPTSPLLIGRRPPATKRKPQKLALRAAQTPQKISLQIAGRFLDLFPLPSTNIFTGLAYDGIIP